MPLIAIPQEILGIDKILGVYLRFTDTHCSFMIHVSCMYRRGVSLLDYYPFKFCPGLLLIYLRCFHVSSSFGNQYVSYNLYDILNEVS